MVSFGWFPVAAISLNTFPIPWQSIGGLYVIISAFNFFICTFIMLQRFCWLLISSVVKGCLISVDGIRGTSSASCGLSFINFLWICLCIFDFIYEQFINIYIRSQWEFRENVIVQDRPQEPISLTMKTFENPGEDCL